MENTVLKRKTKETDINLTLCLEGGEVKISTGVGFFDHMLTAFATHSSIGLELSCVGDTEVDCHHTIEDVGIILGQAFNEALKVRGALNRYGSAYIPLDEALAHAVVDICNRPYLVFNGEFEFMQVGDMDTQMLKEFFYAFATNAKITLHINILYGDNDHHKAECAFKAFAHALKQAMKKSETGEVLSTKGTL